MTAHLLARNNHGDGRRADDEREEGGDSFSKLEGGPGRRWLADPLSLCACTFFVRSFVIGLSMQIFICLLLCQSAATVSGRFSQSGDRCGGVANEVRVHNPLKTSITPPLIHDQPQRKGARFWLRTPIHKYFLVILDYAVVFLNSVGVAFPFGFLLIRRAF